MMRGTIIISKVFVIIAVILSNLKVEATDIITTECKFGSLLDAAWKGCECVPVGNDGAIHVMCRQMSAATVPPLPGSGEKENDKVEEEQTSTHILALSMTDGGLMFLQQDGFRQHNIQTLDFTNNQIATVNVNAFRGLEMKLYKLILKQNNLSVIPSWALTYLHNLQFLHLEHNRITHVRPNTFDETQMNNLQFLHLDHNQITTIPNLAFHRLRLIVLTMANNRILDLEKLSLPPTLGFLDVRNNLLSQIPYLALKDLAGLQSLNVEGNNITRLEYNAEVSFPNEMKLVLRNNKIRRLTDGAFKSFRKFKELDLSYNQINKVYPNCFDGISQILDLDLSYNSLAYIPPGVFTNVAKNLRRLNLEENLIHTVPEAMSELKMLTSLNLNGNKLNRLDNNVMLGYKRSLTELRVAYNHLKEVPTDVLNGMERLQQLDLSKNKITTLEKLAFGTFDGTGTSLMLLNLAGNQIKEITDPAVFLYMSALAYLDLSYNQISEIGDKAFEKLPGLESLFLQNNQLTQFPGNALIRMHKLRHVVLDGNRISALPHYVLAQLVRLDRLSLAGNQITMIHERTFHASSNREIRSINLANNLIASIAGRSFAQLENIQQILLSHNQILEIPSYSFMDLRNLKHLDLSNNRIAVINSYSFVNLPQIEMLSLDHNQLEMIDRDAFSKVTRIEYLDLSHNRLRRIACDHLSHINTILNMDLSHNEITSVELTCVKRSIQTLNLAHNELQSVAKEVMQDFDQLANLSLRHNGILEIPVHSFAACPKLHHLDLSKNHIRNLWKGSFTNQKLFSSIDLSSNALQHIHPGVFGRDNVHQLDLSENELDRVPIEALETISGSLSYLNLRRNKLTTIDSRQFIGLKNLSTLILADNLIETIELAAFENLPNLRVLDISHNPISTWHPQAFKELGHSIQVLNLADCGLFSMPKLSHRGIRHLNISNNKLFDIQRRDLAPLTKLDVLDLSFNNIHNIDPLLFSDMPGLRELNISGNRITHISEDLLKNLYQLETLYASHLTSLAKLPEHYAFSHLSSLKHLRLHDIPDAVHNYNLSRILAYLPPLRSLEIEIKEPILDHQLRYADMRLLRQLTITGKKLRHVAIGALDSLRGLRFHLIIRDSNLEEFSSSLFNTLTGVHFLTLSLTNNRLSTIQPFKYSQIPVVNQHGTVLQAIHLRDNPLRCDCALSWMHSWIRYTSTLSTTSRGTTGSETSFLDTYCDGNPSSSNLFSMYHDDSKFEFCLSGTRGGTSALLALSILTLITMWIF